MPKLKDTELKALLTSKSNMIPYFGHYRHKVIYQLFCLTIISSICMGCSGVYSTKNTFCKLKPKNIDYIKVFISLNKFIPNFEPLPLGRTRGPDKVLLYQDSIKFTQLTASAGTFEATMLEVRDNICRILKSADGEYRDGDYTRIDMGDMRFAYSISINDQDSDESLDFLYQTKYDFDKNRGGASAFVSAPTKAKFLCLIRYNKRPWFVPYSDRLRVPANESHALACNVLRLLYKQAGMEIPEEIAWIVNSEVPKE